MKKALKAAAILVLGGMTVFAWAQPQKPANVIIKVDEADANGEPDGNNMRIARIHVVETGKSFIIACDSSLADCEPLKQGSKYKMLRMSDTDPDGYVEGAAMQITHNWSTGKSIRITFLDSPFLKGQSAVYFIIKMASGQQ